MRRSLHRWVGIPCLAFLLSVETLYGQSILRLGGEFQVNGFTAGHQGLPAVAADDDGDFVIAWSSETLDGSGFGVFARRFNSLGTPLASELQVNAYTLSHQNSPALDLDGNGDFVVVWDGTGGLEQSGVFARRFSSAGAPLAGDLQVNTFTHDSQYDAAVATDGDGDFVVVWNSFLKDGNEGGIFAQRFTSAGAALGIEFQVNRSTVGTQRFPSVGRDGDGDFVVVWQSADQNGYGVFAQRFDSAGARSGVELQVYTTAGQGDPAIAIDGDGDFVVVWSSNGQDGSGLGVFAHRFNSAGAPQAIEFQVNAYTTSGQGSPTVAAQGNGAFVVAWNDSARDGSSGVFARVFNAAGVAQATELQVNTYTIGAQIFPTAGVDASGRFVIAWHSEAQDGSSNGVFARRFASNGTPLTVELQVNSYTLDSQRYPALAFDGGSRFVVAWASEGSQDGSADGVFAQRFSTAAILDVDANGSVTALTDGLLILRSLFGFTGTTLTNGVIGAGCMRCDSAAIVPYLEGLV